MQFLTLEMLIWPMFRQVIFFFLLCLNKTGVSGDWITLLYSAVNVNVNENISTSLTLWRPWIVAENNF